jgi:hypothetical protein
VSYSDSPGTNWGCIVAGAFLFLLGLPMLFGSMMADVCVGPGGCVDKRVMIAIVAAVVGFVTFGLMRLANIIAKDARKED